MKTMKEHKLTMLAGTVLFGLSMFASAQSYPHAQAVVDGLHAAHPDFSEIGIAAETPQGCRTLASTDKSDTGEACEKEDMTPIKTGKAVIGHEGKALDLSLPLRDAAGQLVGSIGIELTPRAGESQAQAEARVRKAVAQAEKSIHSQAELLQR